MACLCDLADFQICPVSRTWRRLDAIELRLQGVAGRHPTSVGRKRRAEEVQTTASNPNGGLVLGGLLGKEGARSTNSDQRQTIQDFRGRNGFSHSLSDLGDNLVVSAGDLVQLESSKYI
jgi:hypothetical protein